MIRFENLRKNYKQVEALKGISLRVCEGELFAYLGPNGSGKTTTIKILTGLAVPSAGDAWLHGFHTEKESLQAKRQCGIVPQNINLDNELTVGENLHLHGKLFQMPRKERVAAHPRTSGIRGNRRQSGQPDKGPLRGNEKKGDDRQGANALSEDTISR